MKINWGVGIAIFYSVFVLSLVFQVIKSTGYDHSLVSEQYYQDDLNYQQHYDKLVNTQQLKEDLAVKRLRNEGLVEVKFPEELEKIKGEIHFFCPSHSDSDFKIPVVTDQDYTQKVPVEGLRKGLWKIKVDFIADNKGYYYETHIEL